MHQRRLRGPVLAALVTVILLLAASAATACPSDTMKWDGTFGTTKCPTMSGPMFQQNGYCFFFPNGSGQVPGLCDSFTCGQVNFQFPSAGTFYANLTYPSPNGFTLLGLQLCDTSAAIPDPTTCPQGAPVEGCDMQLVPNDNGTPADPTDDTMTTTLTCPIPAGSSDQYTLWVYPIAVLNCADVTDPFCAADPTQGVTAALSGRFDSVLASPSSDASVEGGGDVASHQHFALHAKNLRPEQTHVRYAIDGSDLSKCSFSADSASSVDVQPDPLARSGGTATINGFGTVTDATKIKHQVAYELHVTDGGHGGTDTFQLTAPGCDTHGIAVPVQHGNIVIHQEGHHDR